MNTTTTHAPIPSAARNSAAGGDPFDFLQPAEPKKTETEEVRVRETASEGIVIVTIERPDGRSISREVPIDSWTQAGYRESLIERLSTILA